MSAAATSRLGGAPLEESHGRGSAQSVARSGSGLNGIVSAGICFLLFLGLTGCGANSTHRAVKKKETPEAGYQRGVAEALQEIKERRATLYATGDLLSEYLDKATGLPFEVIAGCVVDEATEARERGHDKTIRDYIADHGIPDYSFKAWETALFDLQGYFETAAPAQKPVRLAVGGPDLKPANGNSVIKQVRHLGRLGISVGEGNTWHDSVSIFFDEGLSDFLWGPADSGFAVVRCASRDGRRTSYIAVDLRRGQMLREETHLAGIRPPQ